MLALSGANCKSSRMASPTGVPPGSRVKRNGMANFSNRAASRRTWVDFPQPSDPSNVINGGRGMISILKHRNAIVESRKNRHQSAEYERRRNFGVSDTSALLKGSIVRELIVHSKRPTLNVQ